MFFNIITFVQIYMNFIYMQVYVINLMVPGCEIVIKAWCFVFAC